MRPCPGWSIESQSVGDTADADRPDLVTAVVSEVAAAFADLWEPNGHSESVRSLDVNDIVGRALRIGRRAWKICPGGAVKIEVRFDPSSQPVVVRGSRVLVGALVHATQSAVSMPDRGEIEVRR